MTDRIPLDHLTSDALDALYDELDRLHAGEEPGWSKGIKPTGGQWIARWNQTSPEERLRVAEQVIDNGATAERCFLMNHEKRLARAEAAIARVCELRDDLREITGARWIADMLDTILNQSPSAEAIQAPQPREHCGGLKPPLSDGSERTECVLHPGHTGSHADQHDTRWWRIDQEQQ